MSNIAVLEKCPDPVVIQRVKELLEMAETGELRGAVFLLSFSGDKHSSGYAGDFNPGSIMMAFEFWKHDWIKGLSSE